MFASVGLVSALIALSQPLSYVHAGHQDDANGGSAGLPHGINTGDILPPSPPAAAGDGRDPSLPRYRLADVRKHDADSGEPWVTSGDRVYNITDWVAAHPGGDVILRAAGQSIDPYWAIFTIHKAPHVREILDSYLIGLVDIADLVDGKPRLLDGDDDGVADPFAHDPVRDARFFVLTQKPCNAEPPPTELARDFATPNDLFYVRNHMWVPVVDKDAADQHRLTIELPDGEERSYTLHELRTRFPVHRVAAVLQCSGNRRSHMTRSVAPTNGLQWKTGAISNAVWEGVLLRDVLADAGLRIATSGSTGWPALPAKDDSDSDSDEGDSPPPADSLHVQLTGMEAYGASIPLPVAIDPRGEVLLAFGMNGAPLPRDHGYPLRAVVPGHVAARSVKWLSRIVVADEESQSQWQRRDYKLFGPNEGTAPDWDKYPAIQEMPVTSAITGVWLGHTAIGRAVAEGRFAAATVASAGLGQRAPPGTRDVKAWQDRQWANADNGGGGYGRRSTPVAVAGYAYSGGGREIARVDVSVDGGRTWDQAELLDHKTRPTDDDGGRNVVARGRPDWSWKRWRYVGVMLDGQADKQPPEVVCKAVDSAYNTQPERHDGIYNVRGNLATAWHRVQVPLDGSTGVDSAGVDSSLVKRS